MTTSPLCFVDVETTGIHTGRRVWEAAIVRREPDGTERTEHFFIRDVDLSNADQYGLSVGGFYDRHPQYARDLDDPAVPSPRRLFQKAELVDGFTAAKIVERATRGAHLVGVNPAFDAESFAKMLRAYRFAPAWHHHLIDLIAMTIGAVRADLRWRESTAKRWDGDKTTQDVADGLREMSAMIAPLVVPPFKSDALAALAGVEPAADTERHTALGDARWAMRWYDTLTAPEAPAVDYLTLVARIGGIAAPLEGDRATMSKPQAASA